MGDMDDEEYHQFVCVEAVQTSKTINVKASGEKDKTWKASHVLTLIDAGKQTLFSEDNLAINYIFNARLVC